MIKSIATRKEVWYEEIACRVPPTNIGHSQHCEASAAEDRWHRGTVNRQLASGRKQKVIIKQNYSIISAKFYWFRISYVKYFYNRLRFKVVIDKSCRGPLFVERYRKENRFRSHQADHVTNRLSEWQTMNWRNARSLHASISRERKVP